MTEMIESDRIRNVGKTVTLKTLGEVTVKELTLEQILDASQELLMLIRTVNVMGETDTWGTVMLLLGNKEMAPVIMKLAAFMTSRKQTEFENMPASDWLKLVVTVKEVFDWEEMKELFFQLAPTLFSRSQPAEEKEGEAETKEQPKEPASTS